MMSHDLLIAAASTAQNREIGPGDSQQITLDVRTEDGRVYGHHYVITIKRDEPPPPPAPKPRRGIFGRLVF